MEVDEIVETTAISKPITSDEKSLFQQTSLIELSRSSWHPLINNINDINKVQTYLKGCKWSPDGTCCLTVVNNGGVHLIELPRDLYDKSSASKGRSVNILDSIIQIPESGLIYDYCWYPGMNSMLPETCCWITTRQNAPVQMWDAFDGTLRCSYRGYNAVDEVEAALSICFSNDGTKIHAGYKKCLKTFDVNRPGRDYLNQPIYNSASSLAVSPINDLIAVGSWNTVISLYSMEDGKTSSIGKMRGHSGGITHLQFTPDGNYLVSGARKDDQLIIWDIRYYSKAFKILHREVKTNQRVYFDISKCGKYLVSGSTDGIVRVWNLTDELITENTTKEHMYNLHKDCCNGVSIHPYRPILATSSGQHHMDDICAEIEDDHSGILRKLEISSEDSAVQTFCENSLEFWWTGDIERDIIERSADTEINSCVLFYKNCNIEH